MKILYTGPFRLGTMTEARRRALGDLGHDVIGLDQATFFDNGPWLLRKTQVHLLVGPRIVAYNQAIRRLASKTSPDLIYIDQGAYLWPKTVAALRQNNRRLVHYTSEWFGFRAYWYRHFLKSVNLYDAHVLTFPPSKTYLERMGARRIVMTEFGYDPALHRPIHLSDEERTRFQSDVVFVGHWEPNTEQIVSTLRAAVRVFGPGWARARSLSDRNQIRGAYGEDYVKALSAARICLGVLSKWNHNTYSNSRTFEIPAVGGFLLTERTSDHLRYFAEGKEAEFYGSPEELLRKVQYYLAHDDDRLTVARAGHRRCLTSGYSHQDRMKQILEALL
jgi:hypothetical protein